jgi:very-short-patch-repair endonuclease
VCIICPIHGEFWQRPNDHLTGYGCTYCGNNIKKTTEYFVEQARKVHGDKYDYSKVDYVNTHTKVCIICPTHGEFWQTPNNHLNGASCPYCNCGNKSKMESNIRNELEDKKIRFEQQKTFNWLKYKKNLFLDFYCDEYKLAIEVQGDQHYVSIERFGGQEDFKLRKDRDEVKKMLCEKHGIKMFYITKKNYSLDEVLKYINETSNKKK